MIKSMNKLMVDYFDIKDVSERNGVLKTIIFVCPPYHIRNHDEVCRSLKEFFDRNKN